MHRRGPPKEGRILTTSDALYSAGSKTILFQKTEEVCREDVPGCGEGVSVSK